MCLKFTTSLVEKTISCHLLKNVPLKGSILEVDECELEKLPFGYILRLLESKGMETKG